MDEHGKNLRKKKLVSHEKMSEKSDKFNFGWWASATGADEAFSHQPKLQLGPPSDNKNGPK